MPILNKLKQVLGLSNKSYQFPQPEENTTAQALGINKEGVLEALAKMRINGQVVNEIEAGSTGTLNFSGWYSEEYLKDLEGMQGASKYDEMHRKDAQIAMLLRAVESPIMSAKWLVEAADASEESKQIADFIEFILFNDLDKPWKKKLKEILTFITFGYSVFEKVHKVVKGHPTWGDYIGLKKLAFRVQKTIFRWRFDTITKDFIGIVQLAIGDLGRNKNILIPAENLVVFTLDEEGDNYEGISMLRSCYGNYFRKDIFLKLMGIGIEKSAIGTPIGKYPAMQFGTLEYEAMKSSLEALSSHNANYIVLPQGADVQNSWSIEILKGEFHADWVKQALDYEDIAMSRAFLMQFLMLGSGPTGSFALSKDLNSYSTNGLVYIADTICEVLNKLIKELVILKFGEKDIYPTLKHVGLNDKAGKELADVIDILVRNKVVIPDLELEEFMRNQYSLPIKSENDQRNITPTPTDPTGNPAGEPADKKELTSGAKREMEHTKDPKEAEKIAQDHLKEDPEYYSKLDKAKLTEVKLAEKKRIRKIQNEYSSKLQALEKEYLKKIKDDLIRQAVRDHTNINTIKNLKPRFLNEYKEKLVELFDSISEDVQVHITGLLPSKKLAEIHLKDKVVSSQKKKNRAVADAVVETQAQDLNKVAAFEFSATHGTTQDQDIFYQNLNEAMDASIDRTIAVPMTSVNQIVNSSVTSYLFDSELKDEVESFTFENADPVSEICQYLTGMTFSVDDVSAYGYMPPLHHNCKTFLSPNFRGEKNPETEKILPNKEQKASQTLSEKI